MVQGAYKAARVQGAYQAVPSAYKVVQQSLCVQGACKAVPTRSAYKVVQSAYNLKVVQSAYESLEVHGNLNLGLGRSGS